jgi:L-serine dehydratase
MRAAARFSKEALDRGAGRVKVELFGSLAMTGKGHGTDKALVAGLAGHEPETVTPEEVQTAFAQASADGALARVDARPLQCEPDTDLYFNRRKTLPFHPNGMRFTALTSDGQTCHEAVAYSVGGGFVVFENDPPPPPPPTVPYPFNSAEALIKHAETSGLSIAAIVRANLGQWPAKATAEAHLDRVWETMQDSVRRGCAAEGVLPGSLRVRRRAPEMKRMLEGTTPAGDSDLLTPLDWVNLFAFAVNEENAAGGRVVTAPTNGAAGIIPAVMHYCTRFLRASGDEWARTFLLTAGAIGLLFKENASISGADVGCQGEVGVACSMAAGALAAFMGGTPRQVENAAEIGMEHNLGLTCDPVGGLVQIPCIERNAMGAVKAINAARMALRGDGQHRVSLDAAIKTMRDTGKDMRSKYKETSRGGLAVNVVEC